MISTVIWIRARKVRRALAVLSALVLGAAAVGGAAGASSPRTPLADRRAQALDAFANLPLAFVENQGQTDARVRYYAQGSRYAFYLTREEIVLSLAKESGASADARGSLAPAAADRTATGGVAVALRFLGGNPQVDVQGEERASGEVSYIRGNDSARWRTRLPRYTQVVYRELWPGVDLMLRGREGELKYEFHVHPGASPDAVRLAYAGANGLALDGAGGLRIETASGVLRDSAPLTYQEIAGARVPVESHFILKGGDDGEHEYGFAVGAGYRPDSELIIDPGLAYSTFLGGAVHDYATGITIDRSGNAYIVGTTLSSDFPATPGAFDRTLAAANDVFVAKLNAAGSALVYATYLGGTPAPVPDGGADPFEFGRGIAVDAAGNAYVVGQTTSADFPTTAGAFDRTLSITLFVATDAFVTKLNPSGSGLVYSTFLGGGDLDDALGITVDAAGNAYVTGETGSSDFPTTVGSFDASTNGVYDAFVTKLNPAGSALVYSTYIGGQEVDMGQHIAVDAAGDAYVGGSTSSSNFPTTPGAYDTTANGSFDAFVTKLNPAGSALVYSTYIGGLDFDSGDGFTIDAAGNAYVAGGTLSPNFPTTPGAFDTSLSNSDAFVTKLNPAGSALVYSTLLGGSAGEGSAAVAVDAAGTAWVTGGTSSADFPVTPDALDASLGGVSDGYLTGVNAAGSALVYSTFLGGTDPDNGRAIALDTAGNVYVAGETFSFDFPTTPAAFDTVFDGNAGFFWGDCFVTKFGDATPPGAPPAPSAPSLLAPANQAVVPQPVMFDWTDAANAATYTLEIDDSSGFTAPLVLSQTASVSQATIGGLPAQQLWWRVRGINSAGVVGPFSPSRRFTPQATPTLSAVSLNPTSVTGGGTSQGTVTLGAPAPTGGSSVTLSSSNAAAAVPGHVTVAAGATSATFPVTTSSVPASTTVTISGTFGTTRSATLTVTPTPSGPLPAPTLVSPASDARFSPGQAITFDWTDVAGATSYTIQIDDSNSFSAPLVRSQTVTASQYVDSTLPRQTMWWRVRANGTGGSPGSWSSAREFRVK